MKTGIVFFSMLAFLAVAAYADPDGPAIALNGDIDTGIQVIHTNYGTSYQPMPYVYNYWFGAYPGTMAKLQLSAGDWRNFVAVACFFETGTNVLGGATPNLPSSLVTLDHAWGMTTLAPGLRLVGGTRIDTNNMPAPADVPSVGGLDDKALNELGNTGVSLYYDNGPWRFGAGVNLGVGEIDPGSAGGVSPNVAWGNNQTVNGANNSSAPYLLGSSGFGLVGPAGVGVRYTFFGVGQLDGVVGMASSTPENSFPTATQLGTSVLQNYAFDFYHITGALTLVPNLSVTAGWNVNGLAQNLLWDFADMTVSYQWGNLNFKVISYDYLNIPNDSPSYLEISPTLDWTPAPFEFVATYNYVLGTKRYPVTGVNEDKLDQNFFLEAKWNINNFNILEAELNTDTTIGNSLIYINVWRFNFDYLVQF